jgi:hypothetical protein
MHADVGELKSGQMELRTELNAMRGTVVSMQQDIHNIWGLLGRHAHRLERIENRLELRELSKEQARFEPHP